ncbi:MAG: adenylate/guanylate cyclase domain-containing protein, partial [Anaerolineales bacterium]
MNSNLPTGTVTFLYTDIEGSASLWESEPEPMRAAQQRHDALLQQAIAAHGGVAYKIIGDAFQAAFAVSAQALAAALAAQRSLAAEAWPTSVPLRVRMGLHAGQAEAQAGDYVTTHTLNRVARIMSAGHGGQILLSEAAAELARDDWPAGIRLRDLGQHRVKGMAQPEHLFQVVAPDLPADFPPLN